MPSSTLLRDTGARGTLDGGDKDDDGAGAEEEEEVRVEGEAKEAEEADAYGKDGGEGDNPERTAADEAEVTTVDGVKEEAALVEAMAADEKLQAAPRKCRIRQQPCRATADTAVLPRRFMVAVAANDFEIQRGVLHSSSRGKPAKR